MSNQIDKLDNQIGIIHTNLLDLVRHIADGQQLIKAFFESGFTEDAKADLMYQLQLGQLDTLGLVAHINQALLHIQEELRDLRVGALEVQIELEQYRKGNPN